MNNNENTGQNQSTQTGSGNQSQAVRMEPLAYDIKQAAAKLNVSTKTIRRLLWRGKLTSCKLLRKILIPREQIENFLKLTCDKQNLN